MVILIIYPPPPPPSLPSISFSKKKGGYIKDFLNKSFGVPKDFFKKWKSKRNIYMRGVIFFELFW